MIQIVKLVGIDDIEYHVNTRNILYYLDEWGANCMCNIHMIGRDFPLRVKATSDELSEMLLDLNTVQGTILAK